MPNYTYPQLERLALNAGFSASAAPIAAAIAMAESSGNPQATNHNTNGSTDYGLWQINSVHSGQFGTPGARWYDPQYNAQMAHTLWKSQGFRPWSKYNSGAYHQFVNKSSKPATTATVSLLNAQNSVNAQGAVNAQNVGMLGDLGSLAGIVPGLGLSGALLGDLGDSVAGNNPFTEFKTFGKLIALMVTPSFWLRAGVGALGIFIVLIAVVFMVESSKTVRVTTENLGKAGSKLAETAAVA